MAPAFRTPAPKSSARSPSFGPHPETSHQRFSRGTSSLGTRRQMPRPSRVGDFTSHVFFTALCILGFGCHGAKALSSLGRESLGFASSWQCNAALLQSNSMMRSTTACRQAPLTGTFTRQTGFQHCSLHPAELRKNGFTLPQSGLRQQCAALHASPNPVEPHAAGKATLGRIATFLSLLLSAHFAAAAALLVQSTSRWLEQARRSLIRAFTALAAVLVLVLPAPGLAAQVSCSPRLLRSFPSPLLT